MSVQIIDVCDGDRVGACFYCNESKLVFGPFCESVVEAQSLLKWYEPRVTLGWEPLHRLSRKELTDLWHEWRSVKI